MFLKGKNIVITGCQSGIGFEALKLFSENGANLWACFQTKTPEVITIVESLQKQHGNWIIPLYFDLLDRNQIKDAVLTIKRQKTTVDVLVNIAGVVNDAIFQMVNYDNILKTYEINVASQLLLSQYISKFMLRQRGGVILFTSSITGLDGNRGQLSYGASKSALISAVKTLSIELGEYGIRVNAVAPGVINTHMTMSADRSSIDSIISRTSLGKIGEPKDVVNLLMYLSSDKSDYITGQVIRVDGGI